METPNVSLHFLVSELQSGLAGVFVSKIQAIGENRFKFKLSTKQGTQELVFLPNALYLTEFAVPSSSEHTGFVQFLRKHLQAQKILSIRQKGWDRIVVIEFERADLVLELFASGNIILVGKDSKTMACLHLEEWKDRITKRGFPYRFPASKPVPTEFSPKQFEELLKKSPKKIVSALVSEFSLFPALAEEAVLASGIPRETLSSEISSRKWKELRQKLSAFFEEQKPSPVVAKTKTETVLLPFPLRYWFKEHSIDFEPVPSLNGALDTVLSPTLSRAPIKEETEQSKRLQKLLFSLNQQKKAVQKLEQQALENQQKAEWVYSNYQVLLEIGTALEKAEQKGYSKKEILETLQKSDVKGFEIAKKVVDLDKSKKLVVFEVSA